jgi:hypothetical protein
MFRWTGRIVAALFLILALLLLAASFTADTDAPLGIDITSPGGWHWMLRPSSYPLSGYLWIGGGDPMTAGSTHGPRTGWVFLGIQYGDVGDQFQLSIPPWITFPAILVFPILWTCTAERRYRRQRRVQHQKLCPKCSYDLRAHFSGQRCPECGSPIIHTSPDASC